LLEGFRHGTQRRGAPARVAPGPVASAIAGRARLTSMSSSGIIQIDI
jgi:hypothetical protein